MKRIALILNLIISIHGGFKIVCPDTVNVQVENEKLVINGIVLCNWDDVEWMENKAGKFYNN